MLRIQNFSKTYGNFKAIDSLSLHIEKGDIYGFIGHNGAGKTTTLKAVAGILPFEEGDIFINGMDIKKDVMACKRGMSYIPDNPDIYEFMKGIDYLNFIADAYQMKQEMRNKEIHGLAEKFEILDALSQPVSSYSHGMKQKLAIISAFMHHPKLILMDEPFVGLDPKASHILKEMMKEHCANGGAIFFSTHVLEVAQKLCDKVAILKQGKLVICGNTEEVTKNESLEEVFLELEND